MTLWITTLKLPIQTQTQIFHEYFCGFLNPNYYNIYVLHRYLGFINELRLSG